MRFPKRHVLDDCQKDMFWMIAKKTPVGLSIQPPTQQHRMSTKQVGMWDIR
jgi:hypothetical protein